MHTKYSIRYGKKVTTIYPGEYCVLSCDELIGTVLGSCVAVCLHDPKRGISGLNHFMLPGTISKSDIFKDRSARYGITAMNELFNEMKKKGTHKKDLIAKIFGGGTLLNMDKNLNSVPLSNVRLAKILLELEDIPITEMDVGGSYTRKVMVDTITGIVYLRKSTKQEIFNKVNERDQEFALMSFTKIKDANF
jgi:chemotaxis protein CheD